MMAATLYGMAHMARKPNSSLGVVAAAGEAWRTVAVNQTAPYSLCLINKYISLIDMVHI